MVDMDMCGNVYSHVQLDDGLVPRTYNPAPFTDRGGGVPPRLVVGNTPLLQVGYGISKLVHDGIWVQDDQVDMACFASEYATPATSVTLALSLTI